MKLYGRLASPFVRHCRIALMETNTPFEFIETDNAAAEKSPTKRVPFLQDGEIFLTDSNSILKYVREKAGQKFLDSIWEVEQFCLINTALDATLNLFFLQRDGVDIHAYDYLKRQAARIESILIEIDQLALLTQTPSLPIQTVFLSAQTVSLSARATYNDVHLRLACFIGWAQLRQRIDFSAYKNIENFYTHIQSYEIFKATVPPT